MLTLKYLYKTWTADSAKSLYLHLLDGVISVSCLWHTDGGVVGVRAQTALVRGDPPVTGMELKCVKPMLKTTTKTQFQKFRLSQTITFMEDMSSCRFSYLCSSLEYSFTRFWYRCLSSSSSTCRRLSFWDTSPAWPERHNTGIHTQEINNEPDDMLLPFTRILLVSTFTSLSIFVLCVNNISFS